jgi:hypothetical protein
MISWNRKTSTFFWRIFLIDMLCCVGFLVMVDYFNRSISAPPTVHSSLVSSRDTSPKRKSHKDEGKESDEERVEKKVTSPTSSSSGVHRGRTPTPKTRHVGVERSNTENVGSPKKTRHFSLSPSLVYTSSSDRPSKLETREHSEGSEVILKGSVHNKLQIREDSSTSEPSQRTNTNTNTHLFHSVWILTKTSFRISSNERFITRE